MRARLAVLAVLAVVTIAGCGGGGSTRPTQRDSVGAGLSGVGNLPRPASAWPAAGYDARHSSATSAIGPQSAHVRWTHTLLAGASAGPVIGVDGTIIESTGTGVLYGLDPATGRQRWAFRGGSSFSDDLSISPAVLGDGTILWPGPGNKLFALSRSGRLQWSLAFAGQVLSPAVAGRGRVYVSDQSGQVSALQVSATTHRRVWTVATGPEAFASPTVGPDGTIYVASDRDLVAVRDLGPRGAIRWRLHTKRLIEVSNAVAPDGTLLLGTDHDKEFGVEPSGKVRWGFDVGDYTYSSSTVRPDGTGFFGDNMGRLWIVDTRTGRVFLTIAPLGPGIEKIWTSVAVDAHDDAYWGTTAGNVYGYTKAGQKLFALEADAPVYSYPALGADGTLYLATVAGTVYAIGH